MSNNSTPFSPIIKICGLTNIHQTNICADLGVDWIGFNCWNGSSRYIKPTKIRQIINSIPKSITTVGVFVNEPLHSLEKIMNETGMNLAQLHGDENYDYTKQINVPWFKAFRVTSEFKSEKIVCFGQELFLLDSYSKVNFGGTGEKLDWDHISEYSNLGKLILAGGLNPENILDAVKKVKPWGVDVCSGVEKEPGIKDIDKVKDFIQKLRNSYL